MKVQKVLALVLGIASFYANLRLGAIGVGGRGVATPIVMGMLCIWFPSFFSSMAEPGIRGSRPEKLPEPIFVVVGWFLLLISFLPVLFN